MAMVISSTLLTGVTISTSRACFAALFVDAQLTSLSAVRVAGARQPRQSCCTLAANTDLAAVTVGVDCAPRRAARMLLVNSVTNG